MADTVEREKPKPNPKLMLNQKPTLWLKLMLKPMPTTDTAGVMVDTEVMVDMGDTDMDVNADPLMLTMDMVVMVDTVMDMVDTDMAVNQSSLIFIVPKNQNNNLFRHTKEKFKQPVSRASSCTN